MKADYYLPDIINIITGLGLEENGSVQKFFTNEVWRLSDEYVPFDSGMLKGNVSVASDSLTYESIYSRYQWNGNLMVDPDYLIGAFHSESYGFWSRLGVPKILDPEGRKLNQNSGGSLRGPFWTERMWADRHEEIEIAIQKFIERGQK